ncbi:ABC transporter ATP-binding protein [Actinoplanes missouriensis]|uniref:ABC transporter ATP-binding protein n=1 Tax=Actinoplanes missouriensis TaxID=1866 RepID=UPI003404ECD0
MSKKAAWWVLADHLRGNVLALLLATVAGLAAAGVGLALPLVTRRLIDGLSAHQPVTAAVGLLLVLAAGSAVLSAGGTFLLERTAESVVRDVRRSLVTRMTRLRVPVLDQHEPGDLMARVTADSTLLRDMITVSFFGGLTGVLTLIGVVVLMASVDLVLLGVAAGVMTVTGIVLAALTRPINRASAQAQEAVGAVGTGLERMFGAFRTMKAYGAEPAENARLNASVTRLWRAGVRAGGWSAASTATVELAVQAAFLVVLGVGGARVASGAIGLGTLVAFLMYVFMLVAPIAQVVDALIRFQVGAAGAARIAEVFELPAEPDPGPPASSVRLREPASVRFDDVRFRYGRDSRHVHDGLSFDIPARGMTAFVGVSGAGKTTVFSLLERFYEAESGRVLVNGREVRDWPLDELRSLIGYVEQETAGLSGTLRDNLTYGTTGLDDETLRAALDTVRLSHTADGQPWSLTTSIGHRGSRLSGGERQRLAIARALVRRPGLLLLDEVTSHLDARNEALLRDAITEIATGTTVLVIAHKLSTVAMADRIIVMEAGRVRAAGTHAELLLTDALYAELAATQLITSS